MIGPVALHGAMPREERRHPASTVAPGQHGRSSRESQWSAETDLEKDGTGGAEVEAGDPEDSFPDVQRCFGAVTAGGKPFSGTLCGSCFGPSVPIQWLIRIRGADRDRILRLGF